MSARTAEILAHHQSARIERCAGGGRRNLRHRRRQWTVLSTCFEGRPAVLHRRGNQRPAWACWMPRNARRRSRFPPDLVQGIIAGGEEALARATEASEDDPIPVDRDLLAHGFTAARRTGRRSPPAGGRPYVLGAVAAARELGALTVGISCTPDSDLVARCGNFHRAAGRPGGHRRFHAHESRDRHQAGAEHDHHCGHDPAGIRFGNLMVNVQPQQQQAGGSRAADHRRSRPKSVTSERPSF